ncbi:hypothetical protein ACTQ5F_02405 [Jeotgalibaca porci]|uniref:hypothetical protein n=1 Tax=Jeotgalibaca porci TaxID=1868793 RepID=UPI003F8EB78A
MGLVLTGFTTEIKSDRAELLQDVNKEAEALQSCLDTFEKETESTENSLQRIDEIIAGMLERHNGYIADLATETDIDKAKTLNDNKKMVEEELELHNNVKKAIEVERSHKLYKAGVALINQADTYEETLKVFVSCLEETANKETVSGDINAVRELERLLNHARNTVGNTFKDLGMMDDRGRYFTYEGKKYRAEANLYTERVKSLQALSEFLGSDDYKRAYYGMRLATPKGGM